MFALILLSGSFATSHATCDGLLPQTQDDKQTAKYVECLVTECEDYKHNHSLWANQTGMIGMGECSTLNLTEEKCGALVSGAMPRQFCPKTCDNCYVPVSLCQRLMGCFPGYVGGDLFVALWFFLMCFFGIVLMFGFFMFFARRQYLKRLNDIFWEQCANVETELRLEKMRATRDVLEKVYSDHVSQTSDLGSVQNAVALQAAGVSFETVSPTGETVKLLSDVSCKLKYGVLTAVMGPSGAGKSTLLHLLGGRRKDGSYTGEIKLNGHSIEEKAVIYDISYVRQFPVLGHPDQTALESLLMYTHKHGTGGLFAGQHSQRDSTYAYAALLVNLFKMQKFIGRKISMLSGGQQKLLRVTQVLALKPSVVLLDEPTSGLDALTSEILINGLKDIATRLGLCIGVVIHQPSESLFEAFDEIICLRIGGMAFVGSYVAVKDRVKEAVAKLEGRSWKDRTFPDWLLELAQDHPEVSLLNEDPSIPSERVSPVEHQSPALGKGSGSHPGKHRRWHDCWIAQTLSLFACRDFPYGTTLSLFVVCMFNDIVIALPLNSAGEWKIQHDVIRVSCVGFVLALQANAVLPVLYQEISLQMNDICDGVISTTALYAACLSFLFFVCTFLACATTLVSNVIGPIIDRFDMPYGTPDNTSLENIGSAPVLGEALIINILLSNVFGVISLFLPIAAGDFRGNLPMAKLPVLMNVMSILAAFFSVFGGTLYTESSSSAAAHLKPMLFLSPCFWYNKASIVRWLIDRDYSLLPGGDSEKCMDNHWGLNESQVASKFHEACAKDFSDGSICGPAYIMMFYGSSPINQGLPFLVLLVDITLLSLAGACLFQFRTRAHSSHHSLEHAKKELSDRHEHEREKQLNADLVALVEADTNQDEGALFDATSTRLKSYYNE